MFGDHVISGADGGGWGGGAGDNAGGHQRASLASLAGISAGRSFLKAPFCNFPAAALIRVDLHHHPPPHASESL